MSKLQEKPSALKREHPALQKMKFLYFFMFVGHFCPPGFTALITSLHLEIQRRHCRWYNHHHHHSRHQSFGSGEVRGAIVHKAGRKYQHD
jgi:hypothetical protein